MVLLLFEMSFMPIIKGSKWDKHYVFFNIYVIIQICIIGYWINLSHKIMVRWLYQKSYSLSFTCSCLHAQQLHLKIISKPAHYLNCCRGVTFSRLILAFNHYQLMVFDDNCSGQMCGCVCVCVRSPNYSTIKIKSDSMYICV